MGESMDTHNAAFWLPTHFLTDDDFLPDVDHSPGGFSETERGDGNVDDYFLAELTHHLAHSTLRDTVDSPTTEAWIFSTSPQSTLTGFGPWSNGSPNGPSQVPSPPVTPPAQGNIDDTSWDLLYEAAGQVARLKINAIASQIKHQQNRGLGAPCNLSFPSKSHHLNTFYNQYQQGQIQGNVRQNWYCQRHQQRRSSGDGALGLPQSAWPPLTQGHPPNHHHRQANGGPGMRSILHGGAGSGFMPGVKKQSTGTGVFLPRRVATTHQQPEPRKKPTGCSTVLLPARVVQALNLDLEEMNGCVNASSQSRFGTRLMSDYDIMMARRAAILEQQRKTLRREGAATMAGHEIRLPSDWTY